MRNSRPTVCTTLALVALGGAAAVADDGAPIGPMMCVNGDPETGEILDA